MGDLEVWGIWGGLGEFDGFRFKVIIEFRVQGLGFFGLWARLAVLCAWIRDLHH